MSRNPTKKEIEVGRTLAKWLHDQGIIEPLSQTKLSKGRFVTVYATPYGCLILETKEGRITAIATQIPHDNADAMLVALEHWTQE